jgi:hypothetical protein
MNAYLDLLSVSNPSLTPNGRRRQRHAANSRPLLAYVAEAFRVTGAERLSTAALLAYLDDYHPGWRPKPRAEENRASYLAQQLAMHGVRLHKATYGKRPYARGIWREDVLNAINNKGN